MFPIQEIHANHIKAITSNQLRAFVISNLFGVPFPIRLDDKVYTRVQNLLTQFGYADIEQHLDINYRTHEKWIERFQNHYGFNFTNYIPQDKKHLVKSLVDDLNKYENASFDELTYKHKLMTNLESLAYKSEQEHQQKHGNKPVPVHHKYSINDLIK